MMKAIVATRQLAPTALSRPWTDHLTLDLVCHILDRSVFHPFICFLVPLCLLATHRPAASPSVVYSFCWAWAVTLCHCLAIWNHRLAYGRARTVGLEDEVVLVAGGGGTGAGLGRLIAEVYAMKGARGVAVLDVTVPEQGATEREDWEDRGIRWFRCDVADVAQLEEVKVHIHAEFETHPTILINCAAAPITSLPVTSLKRDEFADTVTTNLISHFNLLSTFLPPILSSSNSGDQDGNKPAGGTIVTLSSILSHFSPAQLAPYSASKAGLSSLHHSLTAEIRNLGLSDRVKTILVEPGQIDTALFAGVQTPSRFLAPVLETREVCKAITDLVDAGEGGVIRLPRYAGWVAWYAVLPVSVQRLLRWWSGVDVAIKAGGGGVASAGRSRQGRRRGQEERPP